MWFVIFLILIALIAGLIWVYQKKKEKRDTERAKQVAAMLAELKLNPHLAAGVAAGAAHPAAVAPVVANPVAGYSKKQRLLPQSGALLYFVFKAGLPDHEIFVNLTLADLVEIEPAVRGYEREQRARKLAQHRLDLVICTKRIEVIAAVLLENGAASEAAQGGLAKFAEDCLQAAGIRLLRVNPAALPRHQQVRELIYGVAG